MDGLMEDFRHIGLAANYELLKHLRRKRLIIALILAILLPLIFYVVPVALDSEFPDEYEDYAKNNLGFVGLLIIICAALFVGDSVAGEFQDKTGFSVFPTPQRRSSIFIGKYLGCLGATALMISIYYLITYIQIMVIYGLAAITYEFYLSFLVALLAVTAVVGFTFFLSSVFKAGVYATLLSFFSMFLIFPILSMVLQIAEVEPWFLVTYPMDLITNVWGAAPIEIPGFVTMTVPDYFQGVMVLAGWAILTLVLGLLKATRRVMQ